MPDLPAIARAALALSLCGVVLDQKNQTFVPHVLAIVAGTTVDFPNSDRIYHNAFSLSRAKSFDLGRFVFERR